MEVESQNRSAFERAMRRRRPVGAVILGGFVLLDEAHWHVLHAMFGKGAVLLGWVLILVALVWGGWRLRQWRVSR